MTYDKATLTQEVLNLLRSRPNVTLTEVSVQLKVNRHTIERACLDTTRKSFREHKSSAKFEEVCRLLSQTRTTSIKEVAFSTGFNSSAAFTRFVRKMAGLTPTELRKRLRQNI